MKRILVSVHSSLRISNRGYVLENGQIVLEGKSNELLGNELVRKAYLGLWSEIIYPDLTR